MSCEHKEISRFLSSEEFEIFEANLDQSLFQIEQEGLWSLDVPNLVKYKCCKCGEVWYLSEPDNAWRGFFLKEANYLNRLHVLRKDKKNKKLGCLFVFFALLLLLLFYFFT